MDRLLSQAVQPFPTHCPVQSGASPKREAQGSAKAKQQSEYEAVLTASQKQLLQEHVENSKKKSSEKSEKKTEAKPDGEKKAEKSS